MDNNQGGPAGYISSEEAAQIRRTARLLFEAREVAREYRREHGPLSFAPPVRSTLLISSAQAGSTQGGRPGSSRDVDARAVGAKPHQ